MYFKSLEIVGFKSFAEKTKLNFEPGVTAIIGPNGCGKSNIADAIRWVLGEQSSKSLRASKMEDVIFNGTDSKDPINFAEVSLTLSNEKRVLPIDYDEVTISRRVFRSGETEYLLNKTPVRLRDIQEMLMGTGIGTESYSIIEQGKMDLILSSKPEERRYVFEEASGITKYKSKKKEALRRLEQTEQNLLRINDIIQEVKRQISSIERQARKAEKYKVDFDRLKELETKLSFFDYRNLRTQEKTYSIEGEDLRKQERDLDAEIKAVAVQISGYRQALDEINQRSGDVKTKHAEMSGAYEMNVHKAQINKERIDEAAAARETLDREIAALREKIATAQEAARKLEEDLARASAEHAARKRSVEDKEAFLTKISKDIIDTEEKVKAAKTQIVDYLSKTTHIKNELIKLGADIQNKKARQRRLSIEKDNVLKDLEAANALLEGIVREFSEQEARISDARSSLDAKKLAGQTMDEEVKALEAGILELENNKVRLDSAITVLEDIIKRYEGFETGVKNILVKASEPGSSLSGIRGVLADIIRVQPGYEETVNILLGEKAQTVITETDSDIEKAINYLADNKLGRAHFVSLEAMRRARRSQPSTPANCTPIRDFVRLDSHFDAILDYFFDSTYVLDISYQGLKEAAGTSDATLVTRSGIVYRSGAYFGGGVPESAESLLIGRKDRLEAMRIELGAITEKAVSLEAAKNEKASAADAIKIEIESLEGGMRDQEISLANVRMKKDAQDESSKKLREELSVAELELDEVSQSIEESTKKGEELNATLNTIELSSSQLQLFIDESQTAVADKRLEREQLTLDIATMKTENLSFAKEEESIKASVNREKAFIFELEDNAHSKEGLIQEYGARSQALQDEIVKLSADNESISKEIAMLSDEVARIEKEKSALTDSLGLDEMQLKDKEFNIESLRNQIRDIDVRMTEINYKKSNLKERITQSYKLDLETAAIELEEGIDWDSFRTQIAELKEKLDRLGPVNLVAIEEHKELEERHAFLIHQQEDLMNAKESLHKAIQKINKTTKELFIDTFQKIQVEFKNFFRLLFGGGQAELVLIDEQDVLETGIEIVVRPPGKKLQNLMLLSGGEKAMTATALLFAIFKVKPSPFCVLDEIDAPLDESNVVRFSNVLKDFLKISQFIIITHNKRTIELADVMYGITMQERGISKIVSVKFLENRSRQAQEPAIQQEAAPQEDPKEANEAPQLQEASVTAAPEVISQEDNAGEVKTDSGEDLTAA